MLALDPKDATLVARVGDRFAALLKEGLGEAKYELVRQRNAVEKYPGVCHSHDFCDANMTMQAAIIAVLELPADWCIDGGDEAQTAFWNEAWAHTSRHYFTGPAPKGAA